MVKTKHRFRPRLDVLERRDCPATSYWQGDVSGDWDDADNWTNGVPGGSDTAIFNGDSENDCAVVDREVGTLQIDPLYEYDLTILPGVLTVNDGGYISNRTSGVLSVWGNTSVFRLAGGTFDADWGEFTGSGSIHVKGGILQAAWTRTTCTIYVGWFPGQSETEASLEVGGASSGKNLDLDSGADISVGTYGGLHFVQTSNSATSGGIRADTAAGNSVIYNYGAVTRNYVDGAGQSLRLDVGIENLTASTLIMTAMAAVDVTGKLSVASTIGFYHHSSGDVSLGAGAVLTVTNAYMQTAGTLKVTGTGSTWTQVVTNTADLSNCTVDMRNGGYNTLAFGGNVTFSNTIYVYTEINAATNGQCDTFRAEGNLVFPASPNNVNTVSQVNGGQPAVGNTYYTMTYGGTKTGNNSWWNVSSGWAWWTVSWNTDDKRLVWTATAEGGGGEED